MVAPETAATYLLCPDCGGPLRSIRGWGGKGGWVYWCRACRGQYRRERCTEKEEKKT